MAESLADLSKSYGEWKYHNQATGLTNITLPTNFKELFVKVVGTLAGGNKRIYNLHFIAEALSNTMSTTEFYTIGFGLTNGNSYISVYCGKDKVQLKEFVDAGSNILSTAVTSVYYK